MIYGIVGPMASGKNYICSQYEKEGWLSLDCDKVVHCAIVDRRDQIVSVFGKTAEEKGIALLEKDGSINRRALGALVFTDSELLKKQESIVYPYVTEKVVQFIEENKEKNLIINATVLYKTPDLLQKCDKVLYVTANPVKRFVRARKRDHLPVSKILSRFRSQKDLLKKYRDAVNSIPNKIPLEIVKN